MKRAVHMKHTGTMHEKHVSAKLACLPPGSRFCYAGALYRKSL